MGFLEACTLIYFQPFFFCNVNLGPNKESLLLLVVAVFCLLQILLCSCAVGKSLCERAQLDSVNGSNEGGDGGGYFHSNKMMNGKIIIIC